MRHLKEFNAQRLKLIQEQGIDYILDPIFLTEEIFYPDEITLSTGIFGLHQD